jgi:hypothetical protein
MPKVYKCHRKLNKSKFNVQIPEDIVKVVMDTLDVVQCAKKLANMDYVQRKRIYNASLREVKKRRLERTMISAIREPVMTFEEFCKPFAETRQLMEAKGITQEELDRRVEERRREFAKRYLGR